MSSDILQARVERSSISLALSRIREKRELLWKYADKFCPVFERVGWVAALRSRISMQWKCNGVQILTRDLLNQIALEHGSNRLGKSCLFRFK